MTGSTTGSCSDPVYHLESVYVDTWASAKECFTRLSKKEHDDRATTPQKQIISLYLDEKKHIIACVDTALQLSVLYLNTILIYNKWKVSIDAAALQNRPSHT